MIGDVIHNNYRIIDEIGHGSLATVYLARDQTRNRLVALKIIHAERANRRQFSQRFQAEAKLLKLLSSPHAARIRDCGETKRQPFVVVEYVQGRSLADVVRTDGPLVVNRALDIAKQVALCLVDAHTKSIVHRDLRPANIMVTAEGNVKVMDFGIAQGADLSIMQAAGKLGTPHYLSPEQASGAAVDGRSDIYSLGVTLFETLSGSRPYEGEGAEEVLHALLQAPIPSLRLIDASIPPEVDELVRKCLSKKPEDRYHSAVELLEAIDETLRSIARRKESMMGMEANLVGQTLGAYRIIEQIGRGGMAIVYRAYEPALDRYVAIKVLPQYFAHDPDFAARFEREAKAVARLNHPNILPIYGVGHDAGLNYIVMQYVEAGTLKDILGQTLELKTATEIMGQIGRALHYAHERGMVHRDVKPANVLMAEGNWVLLTDFGLARMVESSIQLTKSGVGVGTPAYMSPEQGQGIKVDARSDVYSMGVVLYEMVTGHVPFDADTPMAIVIQHITAPLPLPREAVPGVPEGVERVILKALAKAPEDRFQTALEMVEALEKAVAAAPAAEALAPAEPVAMREEAPTAVLSEPVPAAAPRVAPPRPAKKTLPVWVWGVAGAVALLIVVIGILVATGGEEASPTPTKAEAIVAADVADTPQPKPSPTPQSEEAVIAPTAVEKPSPQPPTPIAVAPMPISLEPPDGGKIVQPCEDTTPPQICVIDVKTGRVSQVTEDLRFDEIIRPAWSPNGRQIIFSALPDSENADRFFVIGADGRGLRPITTGDGNAMFPTWSPDGEWIAYHNGCDLWIVRPDGSDARSLHMASEEFCANEMVWSPDSSQIALINTMHGLQDVWVVNRAGREAQHLYSFERRPDWANVAWGPDGQIAVFFGQDGRDQGLILPLDGGEPQQLRELPWWWYPNYWPQWAREVPAEADAVPPTEEPAAPTGNAQAHFDLGASLLDKRAYGKAIEQFNQALELGYEGADLYNLRGWACNEWYFYEGECSYERALEDLSRAIELEPDNAWHWGVRGAIHINMGQPELAIADITRAIELDPERQGQWVDRGWAYRNLGDPEAALADFDRALELEPGNPWVISARAGALADLGDIEQAIAEYTRAIELNPEDASFWADRGWAYRNSSDNEAALADFSRALELEPDNPWLVNARAVVLMDIGEMDRAMADYDRAIELNPQQPGFWADRGWAQAMMGQYRAALADYDRAIELDPENPWTYGGRGAVYQNFGDTRRAIADFTRAIELNPQDPEHYIQRAGAYRTDGAYQLALEDLNKALRLDPEHVWGYIDLGILYNEHLGDPDQAIANFNQAVEVAPHDANPFFHRAMFFQQRGEWEAVIADLTQALDLNADWPDLFGHRAGAYLELGMVPEARADYERFVELTEGNPDYAGWRADAQDWLARNP